MNLRLYRRHMRVIGEATAKFCFDITTGIAFGTIGYFLLRSIKGGAL